MGNNRSWAPKVLLTVAIGGFAIVTFCLVSHFNTEQSVITKIRRYGGWYDRQFGCVWSVSVHNIDDSQLEELVEDLQKLRGLRSLGIGGPITDKGMAPIVKLRRLEWLYVGDTQITDASVPYFVELKNLEYISLSGEGAPRISDEGIMELGAKLPKLREIRRSVEPSDTVKFR